MATDVIIPEFGNVSEKTWARFKRWANDVQMSHKVRRMSLLERVKLDEPDIGKGHVDGLGECYAQIDSETYFRQMQNDADFWRDTANKKKFFKDNPEYLNEGHKI